MDMDLTVERQWLLNIQRKLYQWSRAHPDNSYKDLWSWITDSRNLRIAFHRVSTNTGRNTPGIDGMTIQRIQKEIGEAQYLSNLRDRWKKGQYKPSAVRRHWIPKAGKPNQFRGLGIPTIEDRTIQSAIKQIIEPIFEARFMHVSYGFRPGLAVRDAIAQIQQIMRKRLPDENGKRRKPSFDWIIEGDIKSCFDQIEHHALMEKVRKGVCDRKVTRLITAFLKSGIMEELQFYATRMGTPQGGILSPLLANIALSAIEEHYRRWVDPRGFKFPRVQAAKHRQRDANQKKAVFYPIRYADDFLLFCNGTREQAEVEKKQLEIFLATELGLTLSPEKTKITATTDWWDFLGHRIRSRKNSNLGWVLNATIPKNAKARFRRTIKEVTRRSTAHQPLKWILEKVNPIIQGWGNFYRHASWARKAFRELDQFVFHRIERWLKKKYFETNLSSIYRQYYGRPKFDRALRWLDAEVSCARLLEIKRGRWDMRKRKLAPYVFTAGKPGA